MYRVMLEVCANVSLKISKVFIIFIRKAVVMINTVDFEK